MKIMFLYKAQLLFESELDKKTNAKVLEAVERELRKALKHLLQPTLLEHYIETEVKPKYNE